MGQEVSPTAKVRVLIAEDQALVSSRRCVRARKVMDQYAAAESLSDKEAKILRLIAEGMSNRQIAAALFLAEGTVKNYPDGVGGHLRQPEARRLSFRRDCQRRVRAGVPSVAKMSHSYVKICHVCDIYGILFERQ